MAVCTDTCTLCHTRLRAGQGCRIYYGTANTCPARGTRIVTAGNLHGVTCRNQQCVEGITKCIQDTHDSMPSMREVKMGPMTVAYMRMANCMGCGINTEHRTTACFIAALLTLTARSEPRVRACYVFCDDCNDTSGCRLDAHGSSAVWRSARDSRPMLGCVACCSETAKWELVPMYNTSIYTCSPTCIQHVMELLVVVCEVAKPIRVCGGCSKRITDAKRCGRCKAVYYCDAKCQQEDWFSHSPECRSA